MAKSKSKKGLSDGDKVGIGVALTTAAVAAAGTYFLYGSPNASKNRRKVKGWMLKAKGEVLEALEDAKEMSAEEFEELVESVMTGYSHLQNASKADMKEFKKEMTDHWNKLQKQMAPKKKVAKKTAKKSTKKTAKKTTKKAAKKTTKKS